MRPAAAPLVATAAGSEQEAPEPGGPSAALTAPGAPASAGGSASAGTARAVGASAAGTAAGGTSGGATATVGTATPSAELLATQAVPTAAGVGGQPSVQSLTSTVAPAAAGPAAPVDPAAFRAQLKAPVLAIAAAEGGDSIVTLTVQPERLGPVTVRALIGADGQLRVELFAPNDAGREALRAIAADLRRDLGDAGAGTRLDVSADDAPGRGARDGQSRETSGREGAARDGAAATRDDDGHEGPQPHRPATGTDLGARTAHPLSTIDLLA
ncbi:flagellar hook-length control protein FliK [Arenivirga flava]|uniref:flagellar hook-length control protein FliK n=1 Tax=Arenivirga flava TaxID=1930060 RepID=UPI0024E12628|nr:flagellar hook-length control protein FliK [Arenivirga flava]